MAEIAVLIILIYAEDIVEFVFQPIDAIQAYLWNKNHETNR